jgi:hypothetical protein
MKVTAALGFLQKSFMCFYTLHIIYLLSMQAEMLKILSVFIVFSIYNYSYFELVYSFVFKFTSNSRTIKNKFIF